jgi:chemotaxis protein histidine kinase CheA
MSDMTEQPEDKAPPDNIDVIRDLLRKLEEVAARDAEKPVATIPSLPAIEPRDALSSLSRSPGPILIAPPQLPETASEPVAELMTESVGEVVPVPTRLPPALTEQPAPPPRRGGFAVAALSFSLGIATAVGVLVAFGPLGQSLWPTRTAKTSSAVAVAKAPPTTPSADTPRSTEVALADRHAREQAAREQAAKELEAREQEAREQAAREQAAWEQAAREQLANEQAAAREQAAREQAAREQAAREQAAREQAAKEQAAKEQAAREQAAREKAAREMAAREQAAREQAAREMAAREQAAREQAAREQAAKEQAAKEQAAREQAAREKAAKEMAAREQAAREKAAREKAARELAAKDKAAKEQAVREQAARELAARQQAARRVALSIAMPARIELQAGERRAARLRIEPTQGTDSTLLVVLRDVPPWLTLSRGGALANNVWFMPANAAEGLELISADNAGGTATIKVQLATAAGRILAETTTVIEAREAGARQAAPILPGQTEPGTQQVERLLARGELLIRTGEIEAARTLLRSAAESGSVAAALKLAETYDPAQMPRLGMAVTGADPLLAVRWYVHAEALGSQVASQRLAALGWR